MPCLPASTSNHYLTLPCQIVTLWGYASVFAEAAAGLVAPPWVHGSVARDVYDTNSGSLNEGGYDAFVARRSAALSGPAVLSVQMCGPLPRGFSFSRAWCYHWFSSMRKSQLHSRCEDG